MKMHHRTSLYLEQLETRNNPAPLTVYPLDAMGNLRMAGTPDNANGGLMIQVVGFNEFDITDGLTSYGVITVPGNIAIATEAQNDIIEFDFDPAGEMTGNLAIDMGNGSDSLTINGSATNSLYGTVNLTRVNQFSMDDMIVGGNLSINSRTENQADQVLVSASSIGGSFAVYGGNNVDDVFLDSSTIGGAVSLTLASGVNSLSLISTTLNSNLSYQGGARLDDVLIDADSFINGTVSLKMDGGANTLQFAGNVQNNLSMWGGSGIDTVANFVGTVGGALYFNLYGGSNFLELGSLDPNEVLSVSGGTMTYVGGIHDDTVLIQSNVYSQRTRYNLNLGDSSDYVELNSYLLADLYIDFGLAVDTWVNNLIPFLTPFKITTRNLP